MKNRPIKNNSIKRGSNVAQQILERVEKRMAAKAMQREAEEAKAIMAEEKRIRDENREIAAKERQKADDRDVRDQGQKADKKIEDLKNTVDEKRGRNNTVRTASIAAFGAGALSAKMVFLQAGTQIDTSLQYIMAFGACMGAALFNSYFQKNDIKLHEVLRRLNEIDTSELTPEDVQSFNQIYSQVKKDYKLDETFDGAARKNGRAYNISQGIILALGIACAIAAGENIILSAIENDESVDAISSPIEWPMGLMMDWPAEKLEFPDLAPEQNRQGFLLPPPKP